MSTYEDYKAETARLWLKRPLSVARRLSEILDADVNFTSSRALLRDLVSWEFSVLVDFGAWRPHPDDLHFEDKFKDSIDAASRCLDINAVFESIAIRRNVRRGYDVTIDNYEFFVSVTVKISPNCDIEMSRV